MCIYLTEMKNICRTCLSSSSKLSPIGSDESLIQKIQILTSIQLSLDSNNYPTTICEECIESINKFYCFRKVVINADKKLKDKLSISASSLRKRKTPPKSQNDCDSKKSKLQKLNDLENALKTNSETSIKPEPIDFDDSPPCDEENLAFDVGTEFKNEIENISDNSKKMRKKCALKQCEECQLTFTSKTVMKNHRRTMHSPPGICNICGVVVRADNLRKHMQVHCEDPVKCKICDKVLKNTESLRGHLLIHRGQTYTCETCGRSFKVKSEYHRHLKKHQDPNARKVMCTLCGKRVRELKRHMLTHTGERPYICPTCNKGFTSPYALKVHKRQHTKEKPFICEYCSMGFNQKVSLMTHLKSKHNNKNE